MYLGRPAFALSRMSYVETLQPESGLAENHPRPPFNR
jgi:hypothetical protein